MVALCTSSKRTAEASESESARVDGKAIEKLRNDKMELRAGRFHKATATSMRAFHMLSTAIAVLSLTGHSPCAATALFV